MKEKKKLQDMTDFKVMSVEECFKALGWTYNYDKEKDSYNNIKCCEEKVECSGFIGIEHIMCPKCKKHMVDLFSPIPISNSTCSMLSPSDYEYEEGKYWIAIDNKGGIKATEENCSESKAE